MGGFYWDSLFSRCRTCRMTDWLKMELFLNYRTNEERSFKITLDSPKIILFTAFVWAFFQQSILNWSNNGQITSRYGYGLLFMTMNNLRLSKYDIRPFRSESHRSCTFLVQMPHLILHGQITTFPLTLTSLCVSHLNRLLFSLFDSSSNKKSK